MKTSNIMLITLLIAGLLTLVSSTIALKTEYNKIDLNDPFYGYSLLPVKPFRVLKIEGHQRLAVAGVVANQTEQPATVNSNHPSPTTIGIQSGKLYGIRLQKNTKLPFTYRSIGDTLLIQYRPEFTSWRINTEELFGSKPFVYIMAPSFQTILSSNTTCTVSNLQTDKLAIAMTNARILISNSHIRALTTTGQQGSLLQTAKTNRIGTANITSRDTTTFIARQAIFGTLTMQNDSNATVNLPASLLKTL